MSFQDLNLHPQILKALVEMGFDKPTPIQEEAIPKVLAGFDLRASAQTGTGKTAAFLLPALNKITQPSASHSRGPRVLVLVPTRELAMQVASESVKYSKYLTRVKTVCIYGGAPYPIQNRELSRPHEILVATPGRLIDHLERGRIDFSRLEILILDEADRMLDMGFIEPVEQIAAATPPERQTLMFSATLKGSVMNLSKRLLKDPKEISVSAEFAKHENIDQKLHFADDMNHKHKLLDHLLSDQTVTQAIVFTSTKRNADDLVDVLYEKGFHVAALHGDMNQRQRTRTITQLRQGQLRVLIATDVAARGIDVSTITHVINFDLPNCSEDYVHRIGRTGRAGNKGIAISFASPKDRRVVKDIEQFTGQKIETFAIPGLEARTAGSPEAPRVRKRGSSWGGRKSNAPRGDRPSRPFNRDSQGEPRREVRREPRNEGNEEPRGASRPFREGPRSEFSRGPRSENRDGPKRPPRGEFRRKPTAEGTARPKRKF